MVVALGAAQPAAPPPDPQTALVKQYCAGCHSEKGKAGQLSLASFDSTKAADNAAVAEKMIRKLRAGMMPPPGARRPDEAGAGDARGDAGNTHRRTGRDQTEPGMASVPAPEPRGIPARGQGPARRGRRRQRVPARRTPVSQGFDNVADSQAFSPALMDGYLRAASQVTALAVGDADAGIGEAHYRVAKTASQLQRVDGAPLGTRGGVSVMHTFPADGDYVFRMELHGNADGFLYGGPGRRRADRAVDRRRAPGDPRHRSAHGRSDDWAGAEDADRYTSPPARIA